MSLVKANRSFHFPGVRVWINTKMLLVADNYWNFVVNILMQKYFADLITICVVWPQNFEFNLQSSATREIVWLQINPSKLNESFEDNIYNFSRRDAIDRENKVFYNQLTKKLIAAIEQSHCEGFVAFQDDIAGFAEAFKKASICSIWRSMTNRFLFAYSRDQQAKDYFQHDLFKTQADILVVEADFRNSSIFHIKTNKFVGLRSHHPEQLTLLSTFYASNQSFEPPFEAFVGAKLSNLQGRELIVGAFDYRPFVAVDFQRLPLYHDRAADNPSHLVHVDGTEIRLSHVFCELYNCSLQFDTSEKREWGLAFNNYSGYGLIGLLIEGTLEMAFGGMYPVLSDYIAVDMTVYLGRSGVTCLVPAAVSLASWDLPLRPFEWSLWLAVMVGLCLEIITLSVVRKFEHSLLSLANTWWPCVEFGYATTFKLLINQSSSDLVKSHTVRTFLFACYMFDIILTSVYGGGLSAVLTLPTFGGSADSVQKLAEYNLTWTGSSYAWVETLNNIEEEKQSIYKHLFNNFEVNSMDEMRSKAQVANMGFVMERLAFGHFAGGDFITPVALQRLKLMVDDIYSQFTVGMVPRLWPYLENYNNLILQWHASGLDKFLEWKSTAEYLDVNEQNQVKASQHISAVYGPVKLDMQNFAGLIVLWILGIMFSVTIFVVEIIWFRLLDKRQRKAVQVKLSSH